MVGVVVMLVVPLPTQLIDIMITLNLVGAVVILLTCMYAKRALEFSVFPSLLLIATMYRLALNVSVTRQVLLHAKAGNVVPPQGLPLSRGTVLAPREA
jgi:flagellar biosynthesis protein FlhA